MNGRKQTASLGKIIARGKKVSLLSNEYMITDARATLIFVAKNLSLSNKGILLNLLGRIFKT